MDTKKCNECDRLLSTTEFYPRSDGKFRSMCKECDLKRRLVENMTQREIDLQHARDNRKYQKNIKNDPDFGKKKYQKEKNTVCRRYSDLKKRADKKGWDIPTEEQFADITSKPYDNCGEFSEGKDFCGIDRLNPKLGYNIENCVPCCKRCNYSKRSDSQEQFVSATIKRCNFFISKGLAQCSTQSSVVVVTNPTK